MNFFTHIAISKILYKHFKDKIDLNKSAFMYGNIKPDLSSKLMKKPHILDNYLTFVCDNTNELISGEDSIDEFSVKLGEVCHYVCDFFCLYHMDMEIFNNLKGHFLYELKLHFILKRLSQKEKNEIEACNKEVSRDFASIITSMLSDYHSDTSMFKKDISYAISTSIWVCESVAYFLNKSSHPVPDDEIDSCSIISLTGGQ